MRCASPTLRKYSTLSTYHSTLSHELGSCRPLHRDLHQVLAEEHIALVDTADLANDALPHAGPIELRCHVREHEIAHPGGLRELRKAGYSVESLGQDAVASDNDLLTEVSVRRAYTRTFLSHFEAVVALKVKFSGRQNLTTERDYRGSVTRIDWVNGNVEVANVMNEALAEAVRRIGEDIERIC